MQHLFINTLLLKPTWGYTLAPLDTSSMQYSVRTHQIHRKSTAARGRSGVDAQFDFLLFFICFFISFSLARLILYHFSSSIYHTPVTPPTTVNGGARNDHRTPGLCRSKTQEDVNHVMNSMMVENAVWPQQNYISNAECSGCCCRHTTALLTLRIDVLASPLTQAAQ